MDESIFTITPIISPLKGGTLITVTGNNLDIDNLAVKVGM